eukprot:TRINITY_DN106376_c0_g1_i1.p1 TRINITY_DN106376_c0_g1~~TRINITY_DN106376_c0_g1_i1.p1  ORF type:complete len:237 (-),score=26.95 TRINITY_DN106376_c0_g1_i1:82-756(-)
MAPAALRYARALARQPGVTHALTAGALYGCGDCVSQLIEKSYGLQSTGKKKYNFERTLRMATFGLCFAGPILGSWYFLLHRSVSTMRTALPASLGSTRLDWLSTFKKMYIIKSRGVYTEKLREVTAKVAADIFFFQLPFLGFYFFTVGLMEGLPARVSYERCRQDFGEVWSCYVAFWVPMQTLNFLIVPSRYTAFTVNAANGVFTTILSVYRHYRDYGISKEAK